MADPLALLRRFIEPGALCFDIGAHEGKHAAWMLALGAEVVACEPQPALAARLAGQERLRVMQVAVSDRVGRGQLYVSPDHSYVSTLERPFLGLVQTHAAYTYDPPQDVLTTTLDALIALFGVPAFCKVDVEGHERAVFAGLSQPLPALSFEVHDFDRGKAADCLARLAALGRYEVFFCSRESFEPEPWPAAVDIFGDIYAVLQA